MKKTLLTIGLTIAMGATAYFASNVSTLAQSCQGSCSNSETRCKRSGLGAECTKAFKACLKTGTFTGPRGISWTNVCKK